MTQKRRRSRDSESAQRVPDSGENIVSFDNPPVNEVVCGIGFAKPLNYSSAFAGRFWGTVVEEFPIWEEKPLLLPPGADGSFSVSNVPPAPRYFFRSEDRSELIQLQNNRFLYNWLRTDIKPKYPRYKKIRTRFHKVRGKFEKFIEENHFGPLNISELRLTYVNHVPEGEGWKKLGDLSKVFPDFKVKGRGRRILSAPNALNITLHYPLQDRTSVLEISLRNGERDLSTGDKQKILIFQLSVVCNVADPSRREIGRWFDMAREAIDLGFLDLSSEYMQKEVWGIHEPA